MRKKLLISFVSAMLLLVMVSPINVSVGVVDSSNDSGGFAVQSSVDWWPMFRGDLNHTGYSASVVQDYIEPLWNFSTGDEVWSSPAVFNGTVFVGSKDGYIYALNATTGKPENKTKIGAIGRSSPAVADGRVFVGSIDGSVYALNDTTLEMIWNYTTDGPISSSPAVADGKVFVGSEDGKFYFLDATTDNENGTDLWLPRTVGPVHSSPAVSGGAVYVGSDRGYVYKFSEANGHETWRFLTGSEEHVRSSPAVVNGTVFVGVNDGRVYALNASTGKYLWHFKAGDVVVSSPAVADGRVFVGSNDTRVYALDAANGTHLWNFATDGPVVSSPAIASDKVFVGSCDNTTYALNAANGSLIWSFETDGPVVSSPAIAEGKVFVGSLDNNVYAFSSNKPPQASFNFYPESPIVTQMVTFNASDSYDLDGNITSYIWSFGDDTIVAETKPITNHTYNVAGTYNVTLTLWDDFKPAGKNTILQQMTVREAWPMFRHDPTHVGYSTSPAPVTNETLWPPQTIGEISMSSPAVMDTAVFIGSTNGTLYALNATDGTVTWSRSLGDAIHSSPAVVDNMVFIASENGNITAWDVNGNFLWTNHTGGEILSSPTVSGNRVFIGCKDSNVYAFDKMNGNILWTAYLGHSVDCSPTVASGRVFAGSWDGTVYAINETNGLEIENYTIGPQIRIKSSPAVAYEKVFIGAGNGSFYALNMDCEFQWQKPTGGPIYSSPAVAHGRVFVGSSDGKVYAFNVTNGEELWNQSIGSVEWSSPAVAEGKVFIGSTNGKIYALYEESGEIVWSYQTGDKVDSSPAILNDTLYVGSKDGNVYAFRSQVHDIAVIEVSPSPTRVLQGHIINITVTIRNEGTFNETNINVTASYNSTFTGKAGNITIPSLARGTKITERIQWNTTNVTPGNHSISVYATPVPNEKQKFDNNKTYYGPVTILPPGTRDINVTNVMPFKTVVGQGYCMNITVTVKNEGGYKESFTVTTYCNSADINCTTVTNLPPGEERTITFTWNTTGFDKGNYTIKAVADTVPGETDTADNTFIDGWIIVSMLGDITGPEDPPDSGLKPPDGKCDMRDVGLVASKFGKKYPDPEYDANCDVVYDLKIDMKDIGTVARHFGETDP